MAVNLEDGGFEIRDIVAWIYGSGFPKSLNVGKSVDKLQGNEREDLGEHIQNKTNPNSKNRSWQSEKGVGNKWNLSKGSSPYEGWGTALKPAMELWTLCRKPLEEKTIASNVLKYGTGGINIDGCRVGTEGGETHKGGFAGSGIYGDSDGVETDKTATGGRFPANLIHDGSDEVVEGFPDTKSGSSGKGSSTKVGGMFGNGNKVTSPFMPASEGSASRFFQKCEMVDNDVSFMLELSICGTILENQKKGITLYGVIKEVEQLTQDVEQFLYGSKKMENFQKDIVSIIKTVINQMTELKTLIASHSKNITTFTEESEKTIKWLEELNTEDAKNVKNIRRLITFKNEVRGLIKDIVRSVAVQNLKNGEKKTEKNTTNTTENIVSRIKYCAKASKSERNKGLEGFEEVRVTDGRKTEHHVPNLRTTPKKNYHPTVKPIALMKYLCRLITPKGGTILDPYMGSGSTGIGAKLEGFKFIGIEREEEYCKIAEARILEVKAKL